MEDFLFYMMK